MTISIGKLANEIQKQNSDILIGIPENDPPLATSEKNINSRGCSNVPIYLIQGHGEYEFDLRFKEDELRIRNSNQVFKQTNNHQWIINNTPIGSLGICSNRENRFAETLMNHLSRMRNVICSTNVHNLLIQSINTNGTIQEVGLYTPPLTTYLNKTYYFYDDAADTPTFNWSMGIIPYIQSNRITQDLLPQLNYGNQEYENDYDARLINDSIIDNAHHFNLSSELMKRYTRLTEVIKSRMPKNGSSGRSITQSEIMDILGEGIYISLSCSSISINGVDTRTKMQHNKINILENYIRTTFRDRSNQRWNEFFNNLRRGTRNVTANKIIIEKDSPQNAVKPPARIKRWTTEEINELRDAERTYRAKWIKKIINKRNKTNRIRNRNSVHNRSEKNLSQSLNPSFWEYLHSNIIETNGGYPLLFLNKRSANALKTKFSNLNIK